MDSIDQSVLSCLLADGGPTYAEIGDVVGLSAPAVKRRVDRLRETGAIRGFTALVDPAALGWSTEAYVEIYCKGTVAPAALRAEPRGGPRGRRGVHRLGQRRRALHMLASDIKQLERAIERVRDEPNVDHTRSVIVLSRLIDRPRP
jgi:DNA-binding Lrp family transcriptional regulator